MVHMEFYVFVADDAHAYHVHITISCEVCDELRVMHYERLVSVILFRMRRYAFRENMGESVLWYR